MLELIRRVAYKQVPWKNGLGVTEEIAIFPCDADFRTGEFLWRLSSAPVVEDSEFSRFPHHDRVIVILDGNGARLNGVEVLPLVAHEFSGAESTYCELIDGGFQDLSVFVQKGKMQAHVACLRVEGEQTLRTPAQLEFLFVASGEVTATGGATKVTARRSDTIACSGEAELKLLGRDASLLRISIDGSP